MARAERPAYIGISRQRKQTRRGKDLSALDDNRAVMKRRTGHEDGLEQLRGNLPVDPSAGLDILVQPYLLLESDQAADAMCREPGRGLSQLLGDRGTACSKTEELKKLAGANPGQGATDVGLENYHEDYDQRPEKTVQKP